VALPSQIVYPAASNRIVVGGTSQVAMYAPLISGIIQNPASPADQGIAQTEPLFVNFTGPAGLIDDGQTVAIPPGGSILVPLNSIVNVWVNAATAGHKFAGAVINNPNAPLTPQAGTFPPNGPVTLQNISLSYLYVQYNDDDNLQAFVGVYNQIAQGYLDWYNDTPLPIYTSDAIVGPLLDWVAEGLYGITRPILTSGFQQLVGPFNTSVINGYPFNYRHVFGSIQYGPASDDVFKRILTWHLFKGDGKYVSTRWLKRRALRFITGVNGIDPGIQDTYPISLAFGSGNAVTITSSIFYLPFQQCVEQGVLELPFQYAYSVAF
jgi:hypothetical protein